MQTKVNLPMQVLRKVHRSRITLASSLLFQSQSKSAFERIQLAKYMGIASI